SAARPVASASANACGRATATSCDGAPPAYATEVRPILERRCLRCHAGDGVAAEEHDFSRFETLHAQRSEVADQVAACAMPPKGELRLDEREANTLARWVACGATNR
ncbi:MAG: hypothetical protein M3O50_13190, partial [Myxococcota bacterium]|nr:hypothetical protein [Myxococcota bacterium]